MTANNISVAQGAPIPTLTYTITGFVNGDTLAVVTGSPTFTTPATSNSPIGQYPITLAVGTLSAANYSFNLVTGNNVSIVTPVAQAIKFPPTAATTYGTAPITLGASSSSGLAVSYTVAGPGSLAGSVLTINGAGTLIITREPGRKQHLRSRLARRAEYQRFTGCPHSDGKQCDAYE